jgi:hypothetical protein
MAQQFSPLPTFTLESLVALRQWSAQQRSDRKRNTPTKANAKPGPTQAAEAKNVKTPE